MAETVTRTLYRGKVVVTGIRVGAPVGDPVSPSIRIRVTKVTNRGNWPYPPKVGDELLVKLYAKGD